MTYKEAYAKALELCMEHGIGNSDKQRIASYFKWGVNDDSFMDLAEDYYGSSKMGEAHAILSDGDDQEKYKQAAAGDRFIAKTFEHIYLELICGIKEIAGCVEGYEAAEDGENLKITGEGIDLVIEKYMTKDIISEIEAAGAEALSKGIQKLIEEKIDIKR